MLAEESEEKEKMSGIKHDYTLNSVTALAFYQRSDGDLLVFVGEGSHLKVFDAATSKFLGQAQIFESQIIHGIFIRADVSAEGGFKVAVWGGRSFVLLNDSDVREVLSWKASAISCRESFGPDWILDGAISTFEKSPSSLFVTAHSTILRIKPGGSSRQPPLKVLPSRSQSILYSAHVLWLSSDSVMVAGGTVFGEIEVTVWDLINDDSSMSCRQVFVFAGHEGSIFGVRISPEVILSDGTIRRQLASCSDDRTIRVWDVSLPQDGRNKSHRDINPNPPARETGFRENKLNTTTEDSSTRCIAVVMAHASRIWRIEFLTWKTKEPQHPNKVHLLSFGEDSTCCHWSLDFLEQGKKPNNSFRAVGENFSSSSLHTHPAVLSCLNTFSYHSGKHIWSASVFDNGGTRKTLVSGGADGKVSIYDITFNNQGAEERRISEEDFLATGETKAPFNFAGIWDVEEILGEPAIPSSTTEKVAQEVAKSKELQSTGITGITDTSTSKDIKKKKPPKLTKDALNRYAFVGENKILLTTSFGRVFLGSLGMPPEWASVELPNGMGSDLKSYSLALGVPSRGVAFLSGASGTIYMYTENNEIMEVAKVGGKTAALLNASSSDKDCLCILATTLGSGNASLLSVNLASSEVPSLTETQTIALPADFVVTSAGDINGLLILGARNGSLAVYDLPSSKEAVEIVPAEDAKANDAVTSIIIVPAGNLTETKCHFLVTSRNGSYAIFSLSKDDKLESSEKKLSVKLVHKAFPPLGPMIEAAWFSNSDLFLYGFWSKNFVVWNETRQLEIASIECGGAHRSYAYLPGFEAQGAGSFIYTKASKLCLHSQSQPSHRILKPGGHGREIKACASHAEFIATGAEDTTIRIWRRQQSKENDDEEISKKVSDEASESPLVCCAVIEKHTAGIQDLKWCCYTEDYHSLYSAGGNEEFHIWAISTIPGFGVGVICEATLTDLSEDRDLRIMGFEVELLPDMGLLKSKAGSLVRSNKLKITLIYSDSTIKGFYYSRHLGFRKIGQGRYTSACLTQIVCRGGRTNPYFFTTATDGHLSLWEYPPRYPPGWQRLPIALDPNVETFPTPEIKLLSRNKLHQSSVSAIALQELTLIRPRNCFLIATGGDDNALNLTLFQYLTPLSRIAIPSAHAAAITGLAFKSDMTGGMSEDKWVGLVSVGGDQRVKCWTIELYHDGENPPLSMEVIPKIRLWSIGHGDDVWSSVADPSGVVTWRNGWDDSSFLVVGNGMEVFRIEDGFPNGDGTRWAGIVEPEPVARWEEEEEEGEDEDEDTMDAEYEQDKWKIKKVADENDEERKGTRRSGR